jgi:hypothetical protein
MSDKDVDAQFADIIAHWDDVPTLPDRTAPAEAVEAPDGTAESAPERAAVNDPPKAQPNPVNPPPTGPFVVWRGADQAPAEDHPEPAEPRDDPDEHFEPGPTAPLPPQEDVQFWGIIAGLVGGPLLLLWLVLFRPSVSGWWTLAALGLTVGGFVLLVLRQPGRRDEDDPDDGARL